MLVRLSTWLRLFTCCAIVCGTLPAFALYIPDTFTVIPYNIETNASTLNVGFGQIPISSPFVIEETNIMAGATGFNRNEHLARFATNGETANQQFFGHKFQRSEAWDISFDMKIETPHPTPRKEAGFYFEAPTGNAIFMAASNAGHYTDGPGEIATIFPRIIPEYNFGGGSLGDYNHNGTVDAADYLVWRDTLGSTTDFRANGSNEGESLNKIDQADYDVWRNAFGRGAGAPHYTVGDTLNMRMIYTPPVIDEQIPFNVANPSANVITGGKMEYQIRLNGGPVITSGPLDFTYAEDEPAAVRWMGIPNNTTISLRVQNLSQASVAPDSSKVTFSNFDFDGTASGLGAGGTVPEPAVAGLAGLALVLVSMARMRHRA